MTFDEYQQIRAANQSSLKEILVSPRHYLEALSKQNEHKAEFDFGRVYHEFLLEGTKTYKVCSSRNSKQYRELCELNDPTPIITESEYDTIREMGYKAVENRTLDRMINDSVHEVSFTWTDPEYGIACKARLDMVGDGWFADVKTTRDAAEKAFGYSFQKYQYDFQFAFYYDGFFQAYGEYAEPKVVPSLKVPDYSSMVIPVPEYVLEVGRRDYNKALAILAECLDTDKWPGRPETGTLYYPKWRLEE